MICGGGFFVKTRRFWVSVCLVVLFVFVSTSSVFASDESNDLTAQSDGVVQIMWVNISQIVVDLELDGSDTSCAAFVYGKSGTDEITATVRLKRRNSDGTYTTVHIWTGLHSYSRTLLFSRPTTVATGYTYQLSITATVYNDGVGETATGYDYDSN